MDTKPENGHDEDSMEEYTVLDWVKSLLRGKPLEIPSSEQHQAEASQKPEIKAPRVEKPERSTAQFQDDFDLPAVLRFPMAIFLAMLAQLMFETQAGSMLTRILLYLLAGALTVWAYLAGDFDMELPAIDEAKPMKPLAFRPVPLVLSLVLATLTYVLSGGNRFSLGSVSLWIAALILGVVALWEGDLPWMKWPERIRAWLSRRRWRMELDWFSILWLAVLGVIIFFRAYQLGSIPGEMVSDHAEKLLDVRDVLSGQYSIFFPRNTGREAFQFYLAAATVKLLGTGITFLTLKIGTVLAGLVALPFMYKLGRELGGKWLGLLTMAMAGVAYWPNVISRVGLRFPLFPLFVAPVMFYMVRGLLHRRRNDFLLAGLAVGIGLHGYSPSRVIPILMIVGVVIYMLHRQSRGRRWAAFSWLIGAGIIALIVVVPLLRVTVEMPDMVGYRMLTRMGSEERALPGSAIGIFLNNVGKALAMFANDNGEVWVVSIPHRPALDIVSATFFHLGAVLVFVRYLRRRHWFDLLVLLSIPILQLPSSLSLAFPEENPITNRTAGAIIPVFLIAAIGVMALTKMIDKQWGQTVLLKRIMWAGVGLMLIMSAMLNYDLVFD
ncbi:MAG: glycosyltransferase family 39 protein, partial [Anaerolineales bacterium]